MIIHGAGGHGLVVAESAGAAGFTIVGFVDDFAAEGYLGGQPILKAEFVGATDAELIVAIGDAGTRSRIHQSYVESDRSMAIVVHPSATVSTSASLGPGVFVGPNAVVNAEAVVGDGVIVNSRAVVEHHCEVGRFSHVAPGATLGGSAKVGHATLIGIGASVLPGVVIGSSATIGAGSVVRDNVADGQTVAGSPARPI